MSSEFVIVVDESDQEIGQMEKMKAHKEGVLHRAFSVFIFNSNNDFLLQKRASSKYHSAGLWSNSCCSHPMPNESAFEGAERRLYEELGMKTTVNFQFHYHYKTDMQNGLIEHEIDHVFFGYSDDLPAPNPDEVEAYKYISFHDLKKDIAENPQNYTEWFLLLFPLIQIRLNQ